MPATLYFCCVRLEILCEASNINPIIISSIIVYIIVIIVIIIIRSVDNISNHMRD